MSYNQSDFKRPLGVDEGILLNTNNDALTTYKKAKKRMNSIGTLEKTVEQLVIELERLRKIVDDRDNSTS